MALPTQSIKDGSGSTQTVNTLNSGRQAATDSASVVLSNEDLAAVKGSFATVTTSITRPANTTTYTVNTAWADSTTSATTGGFTLTGVAAASGGSGIITDIVVVSSIDPTFLLSAELWIFDSAVTAVNDNATFTLSDSDALKLVGVVPFTLATTMGGSGNNSYANIQNVGLGFTCSGAADLRFLVKVKNAYVPASGEVLSFRVKVQRTN